MIVEHYDHGDAKLTLISNKYNKISHGILQN